MFLVFHNTCTILVKHIFILLFRDIYRHYSFGLKTRKSKKRISQGYKNFYQQLLFCGYSINLWIEHRISNNVMAKKRHTSYRFSNFGFTAVRKRSSIFLIRQKINNAASLLRFRTVGLYRWFFFFLFIVRYFPLLWLF